MKIAIGMLVCVVLAAGCTLRIEYKREITPAQPRCPPSPPVKPITTTELQDMMDHDPGLVEVRDRLEQLKRSDVGAPHK